MQCKWQCHREMTSEIHPFVLLICAQFPSLTQHTLSMGLLQQLTIYVSIARDLI